MGEGEGQGKEGGEGEREREQIWDGLASLGPLIAIFLSTEKQNVFQKTQQSWSELDRMVMTPGFKVCKIKLPAKEDQDYPEMVLYHREVFLSS